MANQNYWQDPKLLAREAFTNQDPSFYDRTQVEGGNYELSDAMQPSLSSHPTVSRSPRGFREVLRTACKSLGLQSLYNALSRVWGGGKDEEPKVAMYKHRVHAILRCLVHILPVAAALLLVAMNCHGYYIGGELAGASNQDTSKLGALSFAAKLHELSMLASLTAIIFTYLRRELAFGDGLPFGAVFAGLQFTSVSFLWSAEFFGTIYHEWERRRKKWSLVSVILVCCVLGVSVGPSSTNLMKPRLGDWPAGGTTFWLNATKDQLFPTVMRDSEELASCATDTGDPSCPYGDWQVLSQSFLNFWPRTVRLGSLPQEFLVPGRTSLRGLGLRYRSTPNGLIWDDPYTIATVPNSAIADAIAHLGAYWSRAVYAAPGKRLQFRRDAAWVVEAPQPVALSRCTIQVVNQRFLQNITFAFPVLANGSANVYRTKYANFETIVHTPERGVADRIRGLLSAGTPPTIVWFDSPGILNASDSTLNAVVTFSNWQTSSTASTGSAPFICSCAIGTRVAENAPLTGRWSQKNQVSGDASFLIDVNLAVVKPKIFPTAAWAKYLNPTVLGQNRTIFAEIASRAGLWNSSSATSSSTLNNPNSLVYPPYIVESILSNMAVNGIARSAYRTTLVGTLKGGPSVISNPWILSDWAFEFLPSPHKSDLGSAFTLSEDEQRLATKFEMRATVSGWSYNADGKSQKAAIIVLIVYVILAFTHLIYSCWTGNTSDSWDTAPEIAALGIRSRPTDKLENTGAGIGTAAVFKQNVRIRANSGQVEMVFDDTKDNCTVIRPNRVYS